MKQFGLYLPRAPFLRTMVTCSPPRASMGTEVQLSSPLQHDHRSFQIVVASTRELGIGQAGRLPWSLPSDLKFFKTLTSFTTSPHTKNAVIMGRRTWDSLPPRFRPLPGRVNVILSRSLIKQGFSSDPGVIVSDSLSAALAMLATPPMSSDVERVFVIGGAQVYREAMSSFLCDAIHLTEIDASIECDTFMPPIDNCSFRPWYSSSPTVENGLRHCFTTYLRWDADSTTSGFSKSRAAKLLPQSLLMKHEEYQYLELVKDILETGVTKNDRTGTGVISKFGVQMRFNLRKSFPLLTTKRVFWRGVVEELLWLISGSTDARVLQRKGVHIWDSNASKEYLDSIGLHNHEEGDLGPVYGFQWRHFGAKYTNMHGDYSGKGFDQLADVIHKIRSNPDDRRIILSAWNPADIPEMALPPCHMFAQFYVANGELSCQMYQRSCDMGLGVPFNIASYALLTCLLAHVCDLVPGDFVHVLGDAHIYSNHVKALQAQLQNTPLPFPVLKLKGSKKDIDSFRFEDIELTGYECCGKIPMQMAV